MTIPSEKKIALERDGNKCIYCSSTSTLDFHHVFYKALERIYGQERNKADKGVTLCRKCHSLLTDGDKTIDQFSRTYLKNICQKN